MYGLSFAMQKIQGRALGLKSPALYRDRLEAKGDHQTVQPLTLSAYRCINRVDCSNSVQPFVLW